MVSAWKSVVVVLGVWAVAQTLISTQAEAQLDPLFYTQSCPQVFPIVGKGVHSAMQTQTRVAATLLRLHFHDCFVQGCDASNLLDIPASLSEKNSPANLNSITEFAYDTIDTIKASLESSCPNVVSCADIVTLASLFAVVLTGGPLWIVPLGRRDSVLPNFNETKQLISPDSNITTLKSKVLFQNLTITDLVALSGAHTIGLARCASVQNRLYNFTGSAAGGTDPSLTANPRFLASLKQRCPRTQNGNALNVTNNMDIQTPTVFDNLYYKNILADEGLFTTDQELFTAADDTKALVELYAASELAFFADFVNSITKMGNLNVLTGTKGEIRKNCRVSNSATSIIGDDERNEINTHGEHIEGDLEKLEDFMTKVVRDIVLGAELDKLVEYTVSGTHASM